MLHARIYTTHASLVLLVCIVTGPWRGREWAAWLHSEMPSHTGGGKWSW